MKHTLSCLSAIAASFGLSSIARGQCQWDICDHPENQAEIAWADAFYWIVPNRLSAGFIKSPLTVDQLHPFRQTDDCGGEATFSRRWYLTITDLPPSAWWPHRSIQATFYGDDDPPTGVLNGSTFGEVSIWEAAETADTTSQESAPDHVVLVIDFTKASSQVKHEFGVHVMIAHSPRTVGGPVIAMPRDSTACVFPTE